MNYNQKIDTQLNLALDVSEEMREQTSNLDIGYDRLENVWEVIVKYSGNIESLAAEFGAEVTPLTGGYAIVTIAQDRIEQFAANPQIEYMEQPKRLFYGEDF